MKWNRNGLGLSSASSGNAGDRKKEHFNYQDLFVYLRKYKSSHGRREDLQFGDDFSDKEKQLMTAYVPT